MTTWNKVLCIPVTLMLLMTVTVVPTMACSPFTPCGQTGPESAKPLENIGDNNVSVEQLAGKELYNTLSGVLQNDDMKYLNGVLTSRGYHQFSEKSIAYIASVKNETRSAEVLYVQIPFYTNVKGLTASIVYVKIGDNVSVQAVIGGTASILNKPLEILKANETYQGFTANLMANGTTFNEGSGSVTEVISKNGDISSISIKATDADGKENTIYAFADMTTNQMIAGNFDLFGFGLDTCWLCTSLVEIIYVVGVHFVFAAGYWEACAFFCLESLALVFLYLPCVAACYTILSVVIDYILAGYSAQFICEVTGFCSG